MTSEILIIQAAYSQSGKSKGIVSRVSVMVVCMSLLYKVRMELMIGLSYQTVLHANSVFRPGAINAR